MSVGSFRIITFEPIDGFSKIFLQNSVPLKQPYNTSNIRLTVVRMYAMGATDCRFVFSFSKSRLKAKINLIYFLQFTTYHEHGGCEKGTSFSLWRRHLKLWYEKLRKEFYISVFIASSWGDMVSNKRTVWGLMNCRKRGRNGPCCQFESISRHLPGGDEQNHKNCQPEYPVYGLTKSDMFTLCTCKLSVKLSWESHT